eukprot:g13591.t1
MSQKLPKPWRRNNRRPLTFVAACDSWGLCHLLEGMSGTCQKYVHLSRYVSLRCEGLPCCEHCCCFGVCGRVSDSLDALR